MMRSLIAAVLLVALASCGPEQPAGPHVSSDPASVRGWISDVEGKPNAPFRTKETEAVRKVHLFQNSYVEVENAPYVSGGIAENGSFILLDVPPGKVTITFTAPGAQNAKLVMENIPDNADVLVPGLLLRDGGVTVENPAAIKVRVAANVTKAKPSGRTAIVAGIKVPVMTTPIAEMVDRRDYPNPPGTLQPVATVR